MKKTFNINIAGTGFTIDDDAYTLLSDYLSTLEHAFSHLDDFRELIADIEGRISELLTEMSDGGSCIITLANVEAVIARMGKPEDFIDADVKMTVDFDIPKDETEIDIEENAEAKPGAVPPPYIPHPGSVKKFFRDTQGGMIGGVCAGISHYTGIDVVWVRLLTVLLAVLSLSTAALAYVVLCIVVPPAETPYEKMQMMGETPTISNIGRTVTDNFYETGKGSETPGTPGAEAAYAATSRSGSSRFFSVLLKVLIVIGLIIFVPVAIALVLGTLASLMGLLFLSFLNIDTLPPAFEHVIGTYDATWGLTLAIASQIALGIPVFFLIRAMAGNRRSMQRGFRNTLLAIWVVSVIACPVLMAKFFNRLENRRPIDIDIETTEEIADIPIDSLAPDSIKVTKETDETSPDKVKSINITINRKDGEK